MTLSPLVHDDDDARRRMLRRLMSELAHSERAAEVHCQREARRYARDLSATALWTICRQARASLARLQELADARTFRLVSRPTSLGVLLQALRDALADRLRSAERSWRSTLLGLRHGIDIVVSLRLVADALGDADVVTFCDELLRQRTPLVKEVENTLWWFAEHPERALATAGT